MNTTTRDRVPLGSRLTALEAWSVTRWALAVRVLFLAVITIGLAWQLNPPAASPASAAPTEFSAQRAMTHVEAIAQQPHPLGSAENDRVRQYLLDQLRGMGLEPEVQTAQVNNTIFGEVRRGKVNNIIARLRGTDSSRAIMLAAHFDSTPYGPGAADDASGVAALLETVRALQAGQRLRNDIILLITDGEEVALLGAHAFVDNHPWAKDVGVALNLESRGNTGAVIMFETSEHNGWLINQFAQAAPRPIAYSFVYDLYKAMPNDTDLTEFRRGGMAGLNFAMAGGWATYHQPEDNVQSLDRGSLQHFGSYTLALARHLGNLELTNPRADNQIFFTAGGPLIHYPQSWSIPLVVLAALAFVAIVVLGVRRKRLGLKAALAFLVFLANVILVAVLSYIAVLMLTGVFHESNQAPSLDSNLYAVIFAALALLVTVLLYGLLRSWLGSINLTVGAAAGWLCLALVTELVLPGSSYLFVWPLLLSLFVLALIFIPSRLPVAGAQWAALLPAIVGLVLFVPVLWVLFMLLPVTLYWAGGIVAALVASLLVPQLGLATSRA